MDTGPLFTPGSWVEVTTPNAAFFNEMPRGNEQPDQSLRMGTQLKVVSSKGSYVKVEAESGSIGWIPAIMVSERGSATEIPIVPTGPIGASGDLPPVIDPIDPINPVDPLPSGSGDGGFVPPEPEIPALDVQDAPPPGGTPEPVDPVAPPTE